MQAGHGKPRKRRRTKRSALSKTIVSAPAYLTRKIPCYELLDEESLSALETQADWILAEIGIEIRGDEVALNLFRQAGATVTGNHVKFDPGHARELVPLSSGNGSLIGSVMGFAIFIAANVLTTVNPGLW